MLGRVREAWRVMRRIADHSDATYAAQLVVEQIARGAPALPSPPEPSPFASGEWMQIGGDGAGWEADFYYKVRSLAVLDGTLYASLTGPRQDGTRGEVWALADGAWSRIGGGVNGSWPSEPAFVDQLVVHDGALHAAAARGLWRLVGGRWWLAGAMPVDGDAGPYAFATTPDGLAVSFWGQPAVAILDGNGLRRLADPRDGWGVRTRTVYCLACFGGQLYAGTGTGMLSGPGASVFRYDGRGWEKIGGQGLRGSWRQDGIPFVLSLRPFGEQLLATLSRPHDTPAAAANVWAFDGHEWRPVGVGRTPELMASSLIMNDAIVYAGGFVVATGDSEHGQARVWALDQAQCWHDVSGPALCGCASRGGLWIYCLATDGVSLYCGTAGHRGAARVFRFTPTAKT